MTQSISSHVKIWVWESNRQNSEAAPVYGHVALETCYQDQQRYMSFCVNPDCQLKPVTPKGYPAHFHLNKASDDNLHKDKIARACELSFLDIPKINAAFKQFKANPNAWGSLGWGLFGRVYSFNSSGFVVFLLDKGKIFDDSIYQDVIAVKSLTQRIINGLGLFYAAANCWVGYQYRAFIQQLMVSNPIIKLCASSFKETNDIVYSKSSKMSEEIVHHVNEMKDITNYTDQLLMIPADWNDPKIKPAVEKFKEVKEGYKKLESIAKQLENIKNTARATDTQFDAYPWQEKYGTVQKFTESASSIIKRLFGIAAASVVVVGAFRYINNRIEGWYDTRDIVLLAEKAVHAERSHCMRIARVLT